MLPLNFSNLRERRAGSLPRVAVHKPQKVRAL